MQKRPAVVENPVQPVRQAKPVAVPERVDPSGAVKAVPPEKIRLRAYQKWEAAGRPPGNGVNFWVEAEKELQQAK
jgi:hypothetical protein